MGTEPSPRSAKLVPREMTHMEFSILKNSPTLRGVEHTNRARAAIAYDVRPYGKLGYAYDRRATT